MTGRAFTDEELRISEEQLRLATEAADVGLWDLDMESEVLYWPPRVKAMFGISADVPVSMRDYYEGLHPDDREVTAAAFAAALDPVKRPVYEVEYRTIGKEDGVTRWVAAKGKAIFVGGRCTRVIGTAIDITARKNADNQLRELNETLERRVAQALAERNILADIVEATDAFVQVADLNFRFLAINRASANEFERIFGVRPQVGDHMLTLLAHLPAHQEAVQAVWARALRGEEFTATEEFGDSRLGRRHYEMKFNSLRDRDGNLIGAFQFVYDVSDRLRDQARLLEAEAQLRQTQKFEAVGRLTGGLAHDFNNLLMVISGGLSILERPGEPERQQRIVAQMRQATERGASLSRQMLAFARLRPLNPQAVDIAQQIEEMRELLERALRGDVHVKTEFEVDVWPIKVDPAEFQLVVLNLCVNARDAMPSGGLITIAAKNMAGDHLPTPSGDFVAVTVSDTGSGMSEQTLSRIFEPFFTTKEIGKGSGLGLAQVYGFTQQSGGSVKVTSAVGRGTTMTMLLPRSEVSPPPVRPMVDDLSSTSRHRALRGSVLLVEDDDEVASLVTEMFRELGFRVSRVASAQAALGALADENSFDLIFTDILMPGPMNGIDLAREVKRRYQLPILLSTGYAGTSLRTAEDASFPILNKPYDIEALDAIVRAALKKS
jgi:PAS domain S-box-containing protein